MGTQGLLTIVDNVDTVQRKVVVGCNGYKINAMAERLVQQGAAEADDFDLVECARLADFGCDDCLVIITPDAIYSNDDPEMFESGEGLLYRHTFKCPWFNPRWAYGTAAHGLIVKLPCGTITEIDWSKMRPTPPIETGGTPFTASQYDQAIASLRLARGQLEPDGKNCAVCGDSGHQAAECGHNPLVAVAMCQRIARESNQLHDTLHALSGYEQSFGVQLGPARIVEPLDNE